jgi:two-component system alkaline phosphatase synthesis response regulator PhoP
MSRFPARILIVDDDDDFVAALVAYLSNEGYDVRRAQSARNGLTVAALLRPDLILMDVVMEERTAGFFAIQQLRHTPGLENIPVFVLSSIYETEQFDIAPDSAWVATPEFFRKPVDLAKLAARIAAKLEEVAQ